MQYLVVTEDTIDCRWQTELLLESLNLLNLEAVVVTGSPKTKHISCLKALKEGLIKQPFTLLDIDTFLTNKIPELSGISALGKTFQFNSVPIKVFEDASSLNTDVYYESAKLNGIAISKFDYEATLTDSKIAKHIIRYTDGYPPYFTKVFESIEFSFLMPLPFKRILETPSINLPNVSMMQTLVRCWISRNSSRIKDLMF